MAAFECDDAVLPDGGTWTVRISGDRLDRARKHLPKQVFVDLYLVPEVLRSPVAIFQNLKRTDHEDDFCYVGKPKERYMGDLTKTVPFPPGYVFVIMVSRRGDIRKWRLEPADCDRGRCFPEDFKERFGRMVWPKE